MEKVKIQSYEDLFVYQDSYKGMLIIIKEILPALPAKDAEELIDQLKRSCMAIPRLIAEGYAKQHQKRGFQKYLADAHAESNETIVSLKQAKDLYAPAQILDRCEFLIILYDKISRQLFKLERAWERNNWI